jgi:hypothetical protein
MIYHNELFVKGQDKLLPFINKDVDDVINQVKEMESVDEDTPDSVSQITV